MILVEKMSVSITRKFSIKSVISTRLLCFPVMTREFIQPCTAFRHVSMCSKVQFSSMSVRSQRSARNVGYSGKIPRTTMPVQQSLRKLASQLDTVEAPVSEDSEETSGMTGNPNEYSHLYQPCTTVSTCEQYDLAKVIELLYDQGLRSARILLPAEIAHLQYPFAAGKHADVLVLSNGTVAAWGMTEVEALEQIVPVLKGAELRSYKKPESEDMDFIETVQAPVETAPESEGSDGQHLELTEILASDIPKSTMRGDVIIISGSTGTERLLAKAAFSSGLARSTKLAALENSLDNHIESTKTFIDNLASGRELGIQGTKVLRFTGQLLQIRGQLNLYSELIETPDLYWEEPVLESLYTLISRKLDVAPRISILNKKLDYASESINILKSHLSEEHGIRLEWMIIILIMVEVGFEIFHFIEHYYDKMYHSQSPVSTTD